MIRLSIIYILPHTATPTLILLRQVDTIRAAADTLRDDTLITRYVY